MEVQSQSAGGIAVDKSSKPFSSGRRDDKQVVAVAVDFGIYRFDKVTEAFIEWDAFAVRGIAHKQVAVWDITYGNLCLRI